MRPALGHEVKFTGITYETNYDTGQPNGPPNTLSIYDTKVQNQILTARYRYSRPDDWLFDFDGNVYSTQHRHRAGQDRTAPTARSRAGSAACAASGSTPPASTSTTPRASTSRCCAIPSPTAPITSATRSTSSIRPGPATCSRPIGVRTVSGAFVQWKAQHSTWLEVITALRYDNYKLDGGGFHSDGDRASPKATVGITPLRGFTVYGTYAEGYRAPAVTETLIFGLHPAGRPDPVRLHSQSAAAVRRSARTRSSASTCASTTC